MDAERPDLRLSGGADGDAAIARRDESLVRGVLSGDAAALRSLMDHYDRLVRYAVFRVCAGECKRDPSFLDARASEVWSGFVESLRRAGCGPDGTLKAYLTRIARNKSADFLRRASRTIESTNPGDTEAVEDPAESPLQAMIEFENVEILRSCMEKLGPDDRKLLQEMELLTQSRWSEAAQRLKLAESTLRSRWPKVVERLRRCLEENLGSEI